VVRLLTQKNSPILPIHATTNVCYTMRDSNRLFFWSVPEKEEQTLISLQQAHIPITSRRGGCSTPRSAPMLGTMAQTIDHMTEPDREAIILRLDLTYGTLSFLIAVQG